VVAYIHYGAQTFGDIDTVVDCQEDPPTTTEAPTTTAAPPSTTTGEIPPPEGGLPETGDNSSGALALAAGLFGLIGLSIVLVTRKRGIEA
jgi:LPXTG-motif cell wall-anchored protein